MKYTIDKNTLDERLDQEVQSIIEKYKIEHQAFKTNLLAEAFKKALLSGDFVNFVQFHPQKETIEYIPYHGQEALKQTISNLKTIIAVLSASEEQKALEILRENGLHELYLDCKEETHEIPTMP